jgi:hypothetical protein
MPSPAALSLRLQVINRIVTVLQAITAGATYWVKPYEVSKRLTLIEDAQDFPYYMVFSGSGGRGVELQGAPDNYLESFRVIVKGVVQSDTDTVTALEKSLQDIRLAINTDSKSGAAGSLGVLCVQAVMFGPVETDEGLLSDDGFAYFEQPIDVEIEGDFGTI